MPNIKLFLSTYGPFEAYKDVRQNFLLFRFGVVLNKWYSLTSNICDATGIKHLTLFAFRESNMASRIDCNILHIQFDISCGVAFST